MNILKTVTRIPLIAVLLVPGIALNGCNTLNILPNEPVQACASDLGHNLETAIATARQSLSDGCAVRLHDYLDQLLTIAEGDPGPENSRQISEFLIWTSDRGIISRRQAQQLYNRYFNVKFVSLMGNYNNCSQTCPSRHRILAEMEQELADKERGLMKISEDTEAYYRADRLLKETQLVLEATCTACEAP